MSASIIIIMIATAAATFFGGMFALRFKDKRHLIVGFSAGTVLGVAFFDLLPESVILGKENVYLLLAVGFLIYLMIDRSLGFHVHQEHEQIEARGTLRAVSLCLHSFLDGIVIGLAFHIASTLGIIVAVAVLAHDFSDGINTVTAIIKNGGASKKAIRWLVADSVAPVLGIAISSFLFVPEAILGSLLALFCGFFIYIGASDLIPESFHAHPTRGTTIATIIGVAAMYAIIALVG